MEVYTLDTKFQRDHQVDYFETCIWTERWQTSGDFLITTEPTPDAKYRLRNGVCLELKGSDERMRIENALVEEGRLKVSGNTLDAFLNNRSVFSGTTDQVIFSNTKPAWAILVLVRDVAGDLSFYARAHTVPAENAYDIPELTIGGLDLEGLPGDIEEYFEVPFGGLYDAIANLASTYGIGFSFKTYIDLDLAADYYHLFDVTRGEDRTSTQSENALVRFASSLDSLNGAKELKSIAAYKNVVHSIAIGRKNNSAEVYVPDQSLMVYAPGTTVATTGWDRRVMVLTHNDIDIDLSSTAKARILRQRALDALANNNFVKIADGEIIPQSDYVYGLHYNIGDIIELGEEDGVLSKARVTEYIRSQDKEGERAYPTISVIA